VFTASPEIAVETAVNLVSRPSPMALAPAIRATEIRAAIRPYSIAVAQTSNEILHN